MIARYAIVIFALLASRSALADVAEQLGAFSVPDFAEFPITGRTFAVKSGSF